MLFRKAYTSILIIFLTLTSTSCSYFFGKKNSQTVAKLDRNSGGVSSCLREAPTVFKNYFEKLNLEEEIDGQVENLTECYDEVFSLFIKHTKIGSNDSDKIGVNEIIRLFDKLYGADNPFEEEDVFQLLQFKTFFVGGAPSGLTYGEIEKIRQMIASLGASMQKLRPYRKYFLPAKGSDYEAEEFDTTYAFLEEELGALVQIGRGGDETQRKMPIDKFIRFSSSFFGADDFNKQDDSLLEVLVRFKNILLNDQGEDLAFSDFENLAKDFLTVGRAFAEFQKRLQDDKVFTNVGSLFTFHAKVVDLFEGGSLSGFTGDSLDALESILFRLLDLSNDVSQRNPGGVIANAQVEPFFKALGEAGFLGEKITSGTMFSFYSEMVTYWLQAPGVRSADGMDPLAIQKAKKYLAEFFVRQRFINKLFENSHFVTREQIVTDKDSKNIKDFVEILENTALNRWTEDRRLMFATSKEKSWSHVDMTMASMFYLQMSTFYSKFLDGEKSPGDLYIGVEQTQEIYEYIRLLGVEIQFMDSRQFETGRRIFTEANNFSTQRTSDDKMNMFEAFEIISILVSAGTISDAIYADLEAYTPPGNVSAVGCLMPDSLDVLGRPTIRSKCMRSFLEKNYANYFTQLQHFHKYLSSDSFTNESSFPDLVKILERSVRRGPPSDKDFEMGDIREIAVLSYYLQSIFYNFNDDDQGDGGDFKFNSEENKKLEKHFRNLLNGVAEEAFPKFFDEDYEKVNSLSRTERTTRLAILAIKERTIANLFHYIMKKKKLPSGKASALWSQVGFTELKRLKNADYIDLMQVFAAMGTHAWRSQIRQMDEFMEKKRDVLRGELNAFRKVLGQDPETFNLSCIRGSQPGDNDAFCTFAALANCAFDGHYPLYLWMKENWDTHLSEDGYSANKIVQGFIDNKQLALVCEMALGTEESEK